MKKKIGITAYILILIIFLLLSYDFYLSRKYYPPSSDQFLGNPRKYAGRITEITGTFLNSTEGSFYVKVNQRPLKVYYPDLEKPVFGQVNMMLKINNDGTATAFEVHPMTLNYFKYFISIFGLLIFIYLFFKEWKFKNWRFVEKNA